MRALALPLCLISLGSGVAAAQPRAAAWPDFPADQRGLLARLNQWCESNPDECDAAERPEAYPDRVSSGETNGWIVSHRQQLGSAGMEVAWDRYRRRYVPRLEQDVRLVIGGNFAVDHLGPDAHAAVTARIRAQAALALGVFARIWASMDASARAAMVPSPLFDITRASEPALTRRAERLVR